MAWNRVVGYRMRFNPTAGTGDVLVSTIDATGQANTTALNQLTADKFAAVATILTSDKDHRVVFDGAVLDAGPEKV